MFERPNIRRMSGYEPGKQPAAPAIKLNTNENPLAPSDAVMAALATITPAMLQRYPDPLASRLRQEIARYHGCAVDQIVATNGSDEFLRLTVTTFADPGQPIGIVEPGYNLYAVLAAIQDCPLAAVPLDENWMPPEDLAARWNRAGARLALLANPHAPSGTLLSVGDIARLAEAFDGVLLVDEAYVDFVDPRRGHDLIPLIDQFPNLLLARTLSKGHSLAGLRLGYGLGAAGLIAPMLTKVRDSYNVDAVAQHVATATFVNPEGARRSWALVRTERERLAAALRIRGFETAPSEANFLLAKVPASFGSAEALLAALAEHDLYLRWLDVPRLVDCLRITIGTVAENDRLIAALDQLMPTPERGQP